MSSAQLSRFMRVLAGTFALCIGFLLLVIAAPVWSQSSAPAVFATFDVSGAGTATLQGTLGVSINDAGVVAGIYINTTAHGFVRAANGTITSFDAASAGTGVSQGTFPTGINTEGDIAGTYFDSNNAYHGFVRPAASGSITEFDVPGAPISTGHRGTIPLAIDTAGDIAGFYVDSSDLRHGFVRTANGTFTTFDAMGAGSTATEGTIPVSISPTGVIAGTYVDSSGIFHGFVRATNGTITAPIDAATIATTNGNPGKSLLGTTPLSIDATGNVTGIYTDNTGVHHGFVCSAPCTGASAITTFDVTGASTSGMFSGTLPASINAAGYVAGPYVDVNGVFHVFVRSPNGTVAAPIDAPGASTSGMVAGTASLSINTAGDLTGAYADSGLVFHGFVRNATTTTSLTTVSPNPSVYGQTVTITASVASGSGAAPPNGESVSFLQGTTALGTGALSGGSATITTSALTAATYSITAAYSGDSDLAASTSAATSLAVNQATPTITWPTPSPVSAGTALSATQLDATANVPGTFVYSPPAGTVLGAGQQTLSVTFTPSDTTDYTTAAAHVALTVNTASSAAPTIASLMPPTANAGGAAFTLTVNGSNFVSGATVMWAGSALTTTFASASQLTAAVPSTDLASAGDINVTVVNPQSAGAGVSSTFTFVINTATGSAGSFSVSSTTATLNVQHGQSTTLPVTFTGVASGATVTASCVNLPSGTSCSYASGVVTVTTSATTPPGSYLIVVVFTVTQQSTAMNREKQIYFAALLPLVVLSLGLLWMGEGRGRSLCVCVALLFVLLWIVPLAGCSSNNSSSGSGGQQPATTTTQSSLPVTLNVS